MSNYILQKDIDFFGRKIKAGTLYVQHGADYYWPVINDAHVPSCQLDFYTVKNNPEYFKAEYITVNHVETHDSFKGNSNDAFWFQFSTSKIIDLSKHKDAVTKAIEFIINSQ